MSNSLSNIPKNFILSSPESIRQKVLDRLIEYEELHGVDLSKTHFFTYMVDVLSLLSSDNSNALTISKKESYLVTANLPSSVYNWSGYLSYTKDFAKPAIVGTLLAIPLEFTEGLSFKLDYFTKFKAGEITYTNPYEYYTFSYKKSDNSLSGKAISETSVRTLKIIVQNNIAYTSVDLYQIEKVDEERNIPYELQVYQPYSFTVDHPDRLADLKLFVKTTPDSIEEEWPRASNYFSMGLGEKTFAFQYDGSNKVRIMFGNDIFGRQPTPGSLIRVELFTTKANKGSIIANSIKKMDRVAYIDSYGLTKFVSITPVNVTASSQGQDDETLQETKRKAMARFRARNRFVSPGDHDDVIDILPYNLPFAYVKSILKRSDIKANEVVLYVVLPKEYRTYEPQVISDNTVENASLTQVIPIPTNSLTMSLPDTTLHIKPYYTFVDPEDSREYVCPFGLIKENDSYAYYYYIVRSASIIPDAYVYNQVNYPLSFTNLSLNNNSTFEEITFSLDYYNLNDIVDMTNINARMFLKFRSDLKGAFTMTVDVANNKINCVVSTDEILSEPCQIEIHLRDNTTGNIVATVKANYYIRRNLKTFMYSSVKTQAGSSLIYDIPVILKEYYLSLSADDQVNFEVDMLQKMISATNLSDYRMMNVSINMKFAKTIGKLKNYDLNQTTMANVIDILNEAPVGAIAGDRYLVGPEPVGIFDGHRSQLALYGTSWIFLDVEPGAIVYVSNKLDRYTFSGNANRWLVAAFEIPYNVEIFVYVNELADNDSVVAEAVKRQFLYSMTPFFGIDKEQHRSVMYRAIQELGNFIDHCEIKIPEVNIAFNFNIEEFTGEQLRRYVPEFVYCDIDHIKVRVIRK